jgi:phosphate transport system protein
MRVFARQDFPKDLEALVSDVARMGGVAESMVTDAISAVMRRDSLLARAVIDRDSRVDTAQRGLERRVVSFMAERQTGPRPIREGLGVWRITGDLERVADLAKNIAKRSESLNQSDPIQLSRSIERMGRLAAAQLKDVLDAYSTRDLGQAIGVWRQDEDIDAHYNALVRELLTYMMEDPRTISRCTHLMFIAKNIERIGDHCTNIAETVHYLVTGEEIAESRPKSDDAERGDL